MWGKRPQKETLFRKTKQKTKTKQKKNYEVHWQRNFWFRILWGSVLEWAAKHGSSCLREKLFLWLFHFHLSCNNLLPPPSNSRHNHIYPEKIRFSYVWLYYSLLKVCCGFLFLSKSPDNKNESWFSNLGLTLLFIPISWQPSLVLIPGDPSQYEQDHPLSLDIK